MNPAEPRPVRVLVVDDSALMRKLLTDLLRSEPGIDVVATARDGDEAIAQAARVRPDVITLDVEMPGRSGLDVLPELLAGEHASAVIMVSSHTQEGAETTLAALERGAVDFLPKPLTNQLAQMREARDLLVSKVRAAAQSRPFGSSRPARATEPRKRSAAPAEPAAADPVPTSAPRCIAIGISTGGPQALSAVLPLLAPPFPPIVIVQHMPAPFTGVFAARLGRACTLDVKEAETGDRLVPGRILIAPGGRHMSVCGPVSGARVTLSDDPPVSGHKPSVDVLFTSVARVFAAAAIGVIMTGMGRDGVAGCKCIRAAGGLTLGQDEDTSTVYGMNKVALLEGAVVAQFALPDLPDLLRRLIQPR